MSKNNKMIKLSTKKVIDVQDWDDLVQKTYGKPYSYQQQWGCQDRGLAHLSVSKGQMDDPITEITIPEKINGDEMCVKFTAWLARDPKEWNGDPEDKRFVDMWWERNFFPDTEVLANDLCNKNLIDEGQYSINIDW